MAWYILLNTEFFAVSTWLGHVKYHMILPYHHMSIEWNKLISSYYLQYGLAEDTLRAGVIVDKEVSPNELYSQSAIYIAAAHALKPNYSVRNSSLCVCVERSN